MKKKNKKGQMSLFITVGFILILAIILFFIVFGIFSVKTNSVLDQNISIGQVNLKEANAQTFGVFNQAFLEKADMFGIFAIFGMVLGLFLSSYLLRGILPRYAIILDILIIVAIFLFALYMSSAYEKVMNGFSDSGEYFLEDHMPKTSKFMLNLPIFVPIIGAIMMVLFHSAIPRKEGENINVGVAG